MNCIFFFVILFRLRWTGQCGKYTVTYCCWMWFLWCYRLFTFNVSIIFLQLISFWNEYVYNFCFFFLNIQRCKYRNFEWKKTITNTFGNRIKQSKSIKSDGKLSKYNWYTKRWRTWSYCIAFGSYLWSWGMCTYFGTLGKVWLFFFLAPPIGLFVCLSYSIYSHDSLEITIIVMSITYS